MCLGAYRRVGVGCLQEDGGAHGEKMSVYVYGGWKECCMWMLMEVWGEGRGRCLWEEEVIICHCSLFIFPL